MKWDEARVAREADPHNKELIEAEYAAEREHFARVRDSQSWRRRLLTIVIIFAVAAAAWQIRDVVTETQSNTAQVHVFAKELQRDLTESCEQNGNARARVQRAQLHEEIEEAKHPNSEEFHALVAAGVSPEAIRRAEARDIVKLKQRLEQVHLVNCHQQYRAGPSD